MAALSLERWLTDRLRRNSVHIDVPDADTACFRGVPANERFFNKPTTNLLVKRPDGRLPFVVCVDEDLRYEGNDARLTQAFAGGRRERGWRVLFLSDGAGTDLQPVVERALEALGFDGREPTLPPATPAARPAAAPGLLGTVGLDLTAAMDSEGGEPCIGRTDAIDVLCRCLWLQRPVLPVVTGAPGIGKTNLLHGTARRLRERQAGVRLVVADLGVVLAGTLFGADRDNVLASLLNEVAAVPETVVALEHLELVRADVPFGALLLSQAIDRGARIIGTTFGSDVEHLHVGPLRRRLRVVELAELPLAAMPAVLAAHRDGIARHHGVDISDALIEATLDAACAVDGLFPTKALSILDRAACAAAMAGRRVVALDDLYTVARP